jgi:acetoin utilization protein AcuB
MIAKDLINYMVPPLKPDDPVDKAHEWMDELKLGELPVAQNGKFLGLISEDMLYEHPDAHVVSDFQLRGQNCTVLATKHYYDVLSTAYNLGFRLVAVIDRDEQYQGVVSIQDVVEAFARTSAIRHEGAILVLSVDPKDYSLAQISRMIEMNGVQILSSHMAPKVDDLTKVKLTLKLNTEEISQVRTVLENNGYPIEATFNATELSYDEQERFDILMRYLKP